MNDHNEINVELSAEADDTRFLVQNRMEIVRILRALAQHNPMVSAFFNGGRELLLTTVLAVDAEQNTVILDYGSNEALNQRVLGSDKIIFVTALDNVKVQFVTHQIEPISFDGGSAFRIQVPQQLLRLQRREYFRLATPIINPLKCVIPLENKQSLEVPLVDIGLGGIGVMPVSAEGELQVGSVFKGCRIELPGLGRLEVALRVQNLFEVTLKNGNKVLRCGCQFLDASPAMQALLQRYIIKLERERITSAAP